ncbi:MULTISPECIES: hypothetical protein [Alteromonadaceae]|uniref:hypothetical protein n=1 Tax=Alteromonadaceae TaxID=72275 RepID=UPI001C0A2B58|nr:MULTISPECIES: hypothetical protein [Aliiglaciecola]MBU2876280.1 hypothetical protein [Aliiglaciecola lipolytica]MDO6710496.1 hypothetical protein [Aliiglaciecola sp. 2_MG-2023]MDO6751639.1 hypothetical protein [Aliiglaciecola sp. 1_MG-2023]
MPVPLIWLGAGIAALYAGDKVHRANKIKRQYVKHYPGEEQSFVHLQDGAIVCCGIFGVFEHTGIWVDGNIIELKGNGLIRGISPQRFLTKRSGECIYVVCNDLGEALISPHAAKTAVSKLYNYSDYDLIKNNCHRFVWRCVSNSEELITSFSDLNNALFGYFNSSLSWRPADFNR